MKCFIKKTMTRLKIGSLNIVNSSEFKFQEYIKARNIRAENKISVHIDLFIVFQVTKILILIRRNQSMNVYARENLSSKTLSRSRDPISHTYTHVQSCQLKSRAPYFPKVLSRES